MHHQEGVMIELIEDDTWVRYRNIIPRTVPVATIKAKTSSASKSERISLMIVTPFM